MSRDLVLNQNRKVAVTTVDSKKTPDWGVFPPRRLRKANTIWAHMRNSGRGFDKDGVSEGPWFTAEMIYVWYNENYRYDITPNWLGNVLGKNTTAFEKGQNVRTFSHGGGKVVALWKAI